MNCIGWSIVDGKSWYSILGNMLSGKVLVKDCVVVSCTTAKPCIWPRSYFVAVAK